MSSANLAVLALLWAVIVWRIPAVRQAPWKRAPWLAFVFLAVALTADLPPVIAAIDRLSGVTDLSVLVKHLAVTASCAFVLAWVHSLTQPAQPRPLLTGGHAVAASVAIVLIAVFAVMPRNPAEAADFTTTETGWLSGAYLWVFYVYFTTALAVGAILFWRAHRQLRPDPARPGLRPGLLLLCAGCATAVAYAICQALLLSFRTISPLPPGGAAALRQLSAGLEDASIVIVLAGTAIPAFAAGWQSFRELLALRDLRPLWADLMTITPGVSAGPVGTGGRLSHALRNPHVRLIRRAAEIRDSALQLRGYIAAPVLRTARTMLARRGMSGIELDAATEACWLRLAARAAAGGAPPASGSRHVLPGGKNLHEETGWLREIACAYRSPAVKEVTAALSAAMLMPRPRDPVPAASGRAITGPAAS
ncbi:MAG TPA: MAB_1171c family putative transporter [Streptosporangiaceae bacterium]|nr:MAB_1171c family putative transporter [Streptosporangiaceae bacterium]